MAGIKDERPLRSVYPEHGGRALRRAKFQAVGHIHAVASSWCPHKTVLEMSLMHVDDHLCSESFVFLEWWQKLEGGRPGSQGQARSEESASEKVVQVEGRQQGRRACCGLPQPKR